MARGSEKPRENQGEHLRPSFGSPGTLFPSHSIGQRVVEAIPDERLRRPRAHMDSLRPGPQGFGFFLLNGRTSQGPVTAFNLPPPPSRVIRRIKHDLCKVPGVPLRRRRAALPPGSLQLFGSQGSGWYLLCCPSQMAPSRTQTTQPGIAAGPRPWEGPGLRHPWRQLFWPLWCLSLILLASAPCFPAGGAPLPTPVTCCHRRFLPAFSHEAM